MAQDPGQFDSPSMVDLQTMKDITSEETTKDLVTAISIIEDVPGVGKVAKVKFYYFKRGMDTFVSIEPNTIYLPELRPNQKK